MEQNKQDVVLRSYSRLNALKVNLPKNGWGIDEKYIREYHDMLTVLEGATGMRLEEFRIPDNELQRVMTSYTPPGPYFGGEEKTTYTNERYCDRDYVLSKLDAILTYFQILNSPKEENKIGFRHPEE